MAWWGTLIGGTLGYMLGGPLGAMLGAALGRNFDRGVDFSGQAGFSAGDTERVQAAFFTATFSIMGHIAKADGKVTPDEISSARSVMARMQLSAQQREAAMHLFNEGKRPDFPLHDVLKQFKQECHRRRNLVQMFLEIQIITALADGEIHTNERKLLYYIGEELGFVRQQIDQLFNVASGIHHPESSKDALVDAYALLNVNKNTSDADVKKAYRRLMNQHHPDKLVAKGLPEEMIKLATEKTQEIRKAYDLIRNHST